MSQSSEISNSCSRLRRLNKWDEAGCRRIKFKDIHDRCVSRRDEDIEKIRERKLATVLSSQNPKMLQFRSLRVLIGVMERSCIRSTRCC